MGAPRVEQINVVVSDLEAAARFLEGLGVDLPAIDTEWAAWAPHHQTLPIGRTGGTDDAGAESAFSIDLDSSAFAAHWGGLGPSFNGLVVNLRVDDRPGVDSLHDLAVAIGGRSCHAPYDAFWGARYAVVEGPGPIMVGLMSGTDQAHRSAPPDVATFT